MNFNKHTQKAAILLYLSFAAPLLLYVFLYLAPQNSSQSLVLIGYALIGVFSGIFIITAIAICLKAFLSDKEIVETIIFPPKGNNLKPKRSNGNLVTENEKKKITKRTSALQKITSILLFRSPNIT